MAPGGHPLPLTPTPGSPWSPPTHPALPNHCQFSQNSRSFLNSRCRLHGRPYGVSSRGSLILLSPCSRKWWAAGPAWLATAPAHACSHVCTCECTCLYRTPSPPAFPLPHILSPVWSAVLMPPSRGWPKVGCLRMTPIRARVTCCQEVPPPPVSRMSVEAPPTCPPPLTNLQPAMAGRWTGGVWIWVPLTPP